MDLLTVYVPVDWLQDISLVDTPGTNAVIQKHQEITEHFVPRSDLVLFVTSADRPFSESERAFLERIRQWGKKIVVVINKIDLVATPAEKAQIVDFVAQNARQLLGVTPQVFAVSARQALQAKEVRARRTARRSALGSQPICAVGSLRTQDPGRHRAGAAEAGEPHRHRGASARLL